MHLHENTFNKYTHKLTHTHTYANMHAGAHTQSYFVRLQRENHTYYTGSEKVTQTYKSWL